MSKPRSLKAAHLSKAYQGRRVVDDVSLQVKGGEIVGLLGPNGAGKTTSFYMTVGLIGSDGGNITLNAQDISDLPMHKRARLGIGYLPQDASIFRKLTVADNIQAVLQLRKDLNRKQRQALLSTLLKEFHIEHIAHTQGVQVSGGERRRVEIARALAMEPKFILLDEPFAGIDPVSIEDIRQIIQQLRAKKIGILITDHNVRETLTLCDRAYIVHQGQIIAEGSASEILTNKKVRKVYLGEAFSL